MRFKTFLAWFVLLFLGFAPILPWAFLGNNLDTLTYDYLTHGIGQVAGLVGMSMFALTFILSARIKFIENAFGGLDKVYIVHRVFGSLALIMILLHPIFLVIKYIPENFQIAASYLFPFHAFSVDLGIFALIGMVFLIFLSFYTQIKYNYWKISHKFLGIIFFMAVFHVFLIRGVATRDLVFTGYYLYAVIVTIVGSIGYFMITIKNITKRKANYIIDSITQKESYFDIILSPIKEPITFRAGQFFFLRFFNKNISTEPHPFSVAAESNNNNLRFVIKNLGDFTQKLSTLKKGDKVAADGPYGRFNNKKSKLDRVWIGGGIGITPFIGMSKDLLKIKTDFKVDLYYCVSKSEELIDEEKFKQIQIDTNNKFNFIPWISKERGYLNLEEIKKISGTNLNNKIYYICGPENLKSSIINGLLELGISKDKIFEEEFNFK